MAGSRPAFRHLSRDSAHRRALLRNLVTELIKHEHIQTTYAKAKEAQRWAEKLITLAKRNSPRSRAVAEGRIFVPPLVLPKLFGELRERYSDRAGGYTRVLRTEPKNTFDQGESAILEFVDGPRDSRFAMTAMAVARDEQLGRGHHPNTELNMAKVTRFRLDGSKAFGEMVDRFRKMSEAEEDDKRAAARYSRAKG